MKNYSLIMKSFFLLLFIVLFASSASAKPATWYYDPVGTFGLLTMNHSNLFNMYTIIDEASATAQVDDDNLTDSKFEIRAKVSSFYVHPAAVIEQLQSKDFFYTEKYPEIVLKTVSIAKEGDDYDATVDLTMRGVTKREVFKLEVMKKVPFEGTTWRAFRFSGDINRHDYGMDWREPEMLADQLYSDIFKLEFSAEFTDKEFANKEGQEIKLPHMEYGKVISSPDPSATPSSDKEPIKAKDADSLRRKNQATVEKWFNMSFIEGVDLFTEDGGYNNVKGKENVLKDAVFNTKSFPDWKYSKVDVYSTQDPNKFFVEAEGSGTLYKAGDPNAAPAHYANTYIMVFIMQDGKIKSVTEKMSELNLLKALGVDIPMDTLRGSDSEDKGR